MTYDPVHAVRDERMGGANGEFEREVRAKGAEAVGAEEGACDSEDDAGEEGGRECGECGGGLQWV